MRAIFKKQNRRVIVTVALCLCIGLITVSGVWAYLISKTDTKTNTFLPASVTCAVEEEFSNGVKSNVKIKNTGNVNAYIRVAVVATFVSEDGTVHATAPQEGVDYTVIWSNSGWKKGSDGFWYYADPVLPEALTANLIESVTASSTAPDSFRLNVQIVASAIQSEPATAVGEAWGVTPSNEKLVPN